MATATVHISTDLHLTGSYEPTGDVLYLSAVGDQEDAALQETPEGHAVRLDASGRVTHITAVNARWLLERRRARRLARRRSPAEARSRWPRRLDRPEGRRVIALLARRRRDRSRLCLLRRSEAGAAGSVKKREREHAGVTLLHVAQRRSAWHRCPSSTRGAAWAPPRRASLGTREQQRERRQRAAGRSRT